MLYALGSNGAGQLGLGHINDISSPEPILIEGNRPPWKVTQLAVGGSHTVILCDDGRVRVTGDNDGGVCGLDGINQTTHFTDVPLPQDEATGEPIKICQVAATWASTLFLTFEGEVFVCGKGPSGELGLGHGITASPSIRPLEAFGPEQVKVVFIASGMGHSIAVLSNGEVYGWGKGRNGQLGRAEDAIWKPRRIKGVSFNPVYAACGKDFTILAGEPTVGEFLILGGGRNDRFGIQANAPSSIAGWKSIDASWRGIYVHTNDGKLIAWGRNDHGQLPLPRLEKVQTFAAGSEHCLAVTAAGNAVAFGWGEHGNCGSPTDDRGDVKGTFNTLQVPGPVLKVFAGCATSFIEVDNDTPG